MLNKSLPALRHGVRPARRGRGLRNPKRENWKQSPGLRRGEGSTFEVEPRTESATLTGAAQGEPSSLQDVVQDVGTP